MDGRRRSRPLGRVAVEVQLQFIHVGGIELGSRNHLDEITTGTGAFLYFNAHRGEGLILAFRLDVIGFPCGLDREVHRLLLAGVQSVGICLLDEGEFTDIVVGDGHIHLSGALIIIDALGDGEMDHMVLFIHDGADPRGLGHIHPDGAKFAVRQIKLTTGIREGIAVIPRKGRIDTKLLGDDLSRRITGSQGDRRVTGLIGLIPVNGQRHTVPRNACADPGTVRAGGEGLIRIDYNDTVATLRSENHVLGKDLQSGSRQISGAIGLVVGLRNDIGGEKGKRGNQCQKY